MKLGFQQSGAWPWINGLMPAARHESGAPEPRASLRPDGTSAVLARAMALPLLMLAAAVVAALLH
jgi:hypothetical protein